MKIADTALMKTVIPILFALLLSLALVAGCSSPFAGDTLIALPVGGEPTEADWEQTVPLDLTVWMGNVNIPDDIVALDMETSHRSTPECHHGPSTSDPVIVRVRALYNLDKLYMDLEWPDKTRDVELGTWDFGPEGWTARPDADDGVAILWEPPGSRSEDDPFRCQYACHMVEVDVYDGGTKMQMGMKAPNDQVMDLWRWRASMEELYGLADDMVIDNGGKRGDAGLVVTRENRPMTYIYSENKGVGKMERRTEPYYLVQAPSGRQGDVSAGATWDDGKWHVKLTRELDSADRDDVIYTPGDRVPFSIAVFDNTFSEHHVSAGSAVLVLWQDRKDIEKRRIIDEPMDF